MPKHLGKSVHEILPKTLAQFAENPSKSPHPFRRKLQQIAYMRPFFPRLQGTKCRFTKYFDVAGTEMAAFVCFSSVFASFVKQHRLTIFFGTTRRGFDTQQSTKPERFRNHCPVHHNSHTHIYKRGATQMRGAQVAHGRAKIKGMTTYQQSAGLCIQAVDQLALLTPREWRPPS